MVQRIYCRMSASIDELTDNPLEILAAGEGEAVVVFANDQPAFYRVPPALFSLLYASHAAEVDIASQDASGGSIATSKGC